MFKFLFLLITIVWTLSFSDVHASITREYDPGDTISLTGSSNWVIFGVHEIVGSSSSAGPYLDTTSRKLEGALYIRGLWWGLLSSGSLITTLDCSEAYELLTAPCRLSGSWWSEMVWEIGMSDIVYDPVYATLSGTIRTFAGDYPIAGIELPLRPVDIETDLSDLQTNHATEIKVGTGKDTYGSHSWILITSINGATEWLWGWAGIFSNVDLTLAGDYTITVTDPNGSETIYRNIMVDPSIATNSLSTNPAYRIDAYCKWKPLLCPDGSTLQATHIDRVGANIVADGSGSHEVRVHMRDTYGNRIDTGGITISMSGTVDRIMWTPAENDAIVLRDQTFIPDGSSASWKSLAINLLLDPSPSFRISSLAPTSPDGTITLKWIMYTDPQGTIVPLVFNESFTFEPWITASTTAPNPILINHENFFSVQTTPHTNARIDITPHMIQTIQIGTGQHAGMRTFISNPPYLCQAYPQDTSLYTGECSWTSLPGESLPSIFRMNTIIPYTFTGVYAPFTEYPQIENTLSTQYLSYTGTNTLGVEVPVLYQVGYTSLGASQFGKSNVKIIGQNNAQWEYGDLITHRGMRAKLFDEIRKVTSILKRNREDTDSYTDVPYKIYVWDHTLRQSDFTSKRSIIVIGGDITIDEDIKNTTGSPLAIIARSDDLGHGGMITIGPNVKKIEAGIFAEKSIRSSGDNQLHIVGTLISANTMGDTTAGICPYHETMCNQAIAKEYDLEYLREGYLSHAPWDRSTHRDPNNISTKHEEYPLIIEYDMRLVTDPPPGIK